MGPKTSFSGISLPPQQVSNPAIEDAPLPKRVVLPLGQNGNRVCTPVVEVGEHVKTGQLIGESDDFLVAPVHSSLSGTVADIRPWFDQSGNEMLSVIIESDGNDDWEEELRRDESFLEKERGQILRDLKAASVVEIGPPLHASPRQVCPTRTPKRVSFFGGNSPG